MHLLVYDILKLNYADSFVKCRNISSWWIPVYSSNHIIFIMKFFLFIMYIYLFMHLKIEKLCSYLYHNAYKIFSTYFMFTKKYDWFRLLILNFELILIALYSIIYNTYDLDEIFLLDNFLSVFRLLYQHTVTKSVHRCSCFQTLSLSMLYDLTGLNVNILSYFIIIYFHFLKFSWLNSCLANNILQMILFHSFSNVDSVNIWFDSRY